MATRFFHNDLVNRCLDGDRMMRGTVVSTHHEVSTHRPEPGSDSPFPIECHDDVTEPVFLQFLRDGIPLHGLIYVVWSTGPKICQELVPVSSVNLESREFWIGDVVKRNVSDLMSGVVLNTHTTCTLECVQDIPYRDTHIVRGLLPPNIDWREPGDLSSPSPPAPLLHGVSAEDLEDLDDDTDYRLVMYKDWFGEVIESKYVVWLRLADGFIVELDDQQGAFLQGGFGECCVGDIKFSKKGDLRRGRWILGEYNPNTPPVGTVVSVRVTEITVDWLDNGFFRTAPEQGEDTLPPPEILSRIELDSPDFSVYDRTLRPRLGPSNPAYERSRTRTYPEIAAHRFARVRFHDFDAAMLKYAKDLPPGSVPDLRREKNSGFDLNVFTVFQSKTEVTVQWQDLSVTSGAAEDFVPIEAENDVHVSWPGNIAHTLASSTKPDEPGVRFPNRVGVVQTVNRAEAMATMRWLPHAEVLYLSKLTDLNPLVSEDHLKFGIASETVEEVSLYELMPLLSDIDIGEIVAIRRGALLAAGISPKTRNFGEIVEVLLDGKIVVRLGAAETVQDIVITRDDARFVVSCEPEDDEAEDDEVDDDDDIDDDMSDALSYGYSGDLEPIANYEDEFGNPMTSMDAEDDDWVSDSMEINEDEVSLDADEAQHNSSRRPLLEQTGSLPSSDQNAFRYTNEAAATYLVLDGPVPEDHGFFHHQPSSGSAYMKRIQKEQKRLQDPKSLPEGVYVRTWESRLDLFRVLFLGPSETPYASIPMVMDFCLPGAFPQEPPQAFFHSWPSWSGLGGLDRINPNLYEDGKVCLSLLGTWPGLPTESWNSAQSTFLQVLVSILGLVLVREPYYNEAGYDVVGTDSSKTFSIRYNEQVSLRARGFLISALTHLHPIPSIGGTLCSGLGGVEDVIWWVYWNKNGPRLVDSVIKDSEEVLRRSGAGEPSNGLTVVTKGACVSLRRIVDRLIELQLCN